MKLAELAEIRIGQSINSNSLLAHKPQEGNYFQYLESANFKGVPSRFVSEKHLRAKKVTAKRISLKYGDYFLVKVDEYKMFRYEQVDTTIPSDEIIVISSNVGIINQFFGYEKNRKYFLSELRRKISDSVSIIDILSSIEIMTNDIKELEESDIADQIGISKPVKKEDLPFRLTQKRMTLDKLMKRIQYGELVLDTEFQRRPGLWDLNTKSKFIEALIVRLPVPAFYFDGSNDNEWLVIDGLQRLSTINAFINNEFALTNLDFLGELQDKKFENLDRPFQRNIEEYEVFSYIIEKGTPQSVKYKIFKNINTSALRLEPQEIRHAINPGKPATFVKKIAEAKWFKDYVPTTKQDRMYDREVVLRFITFQNRHYTDYRPSIVEYLDETITCIYDIPQHSLNDYEKDLERICSGLHSIIEEPCFSRSVFNDSKSYIHNNILFEVLTYGFSKIRIEDFPKLLKKKAEIKSELIEYFRNQNVQFWDRDFAYSKEGLEKRFKEMEVFISKINKQYI